MGRVTDNAFLQPDTVASVLSTWPEERLLSLFEKRGDLITGKPLNWEIIGRRFALAGGGRSAIYRADASVRAIVDVSRLDPAPPTVLEVCDRFGGGVEESTVRGAISRMEELGLGLLVDNRVFVVQEFWEYPYPAGLGPSISKLLVFRTNKELIGILAKLKTRGFVVQSGTQAEMISLIGECLTVTSSVLDIVQDGPTGTLELFDTLLSSGSPSIRDFAHYFANDTSSAIRYLASYGIISPNFQYSDIYVLPMEIGLAFRGGKPYPEGLSEPPSVPATPINPEKVDSSAVTAANQLLNDLESLIRAIEAERYEPLKSGGIRIKDLRRLAKLIGHSEAETSRLLGVAWFGRLVGVSDEERKFCLTKYWDTWEMYPPSRRWAEIVESWLVSGPSIGLVGKTDQNNKTLPPLVDLGYSELLNYAFQACFELLSELGPHKAIDREALDNYLNWCIPTTQRYRVEVYQYLSSLFFDAAEVLGVVADGALSSFGHLALSRNITATTEAIASFLPKPSTSFLLGSDLTALVDGSLAADIRGFLEQIADLESTGVVSLYRFSEASIRGALDAGLNGEEITKFLETYGTKGLPQTLGYLIKDVIRRFGSIRVGAVSCYLNIPDQALSTEVLRNKKLAKLRLRPLGSTILVSPIDLAVVLEELRSAGYLPVAESDNGGHITESRKKLRVDVNPRGYVKFPAKEVDSTKELISRLRAEAVMVPLPRVQTEPSANDLVIQRGRPISIFDLDVEFDDVEFDDVEFDDDEFDDDEEEFE